MSCRSISVTELMRRRDRGEFVELIDVRTPAEFRTVHAEMARNVPLDQLQPQALVAERTDQSAPLYLICQAGTRGAKAAERFIQAGYENVVNVEGGTRAWAQAGLPVVRGKTTMSLERQVRIAAGAIVLVSALMGIVVHPYFSAIAAFVGGGLMFAGLTDTCAMGMLIARMPWNQISSHEASTA